MRLAGMVIALCALLVVSGCSRQIAETTAPKAAVALAKKTVNDLRAQNRGELAKDAEPELAAILCQPATLQRLLSKFPKTAVVAEHVETWQSTRFFGNLFGRALNPKYEPLDRTTLSLRYEFVGGDAVRLNFTLVPVAGRLRVYGIHVEPLPAILLQHAKFAAHITPFNVVFLLLAVAVVGFMAMTAVTCLRTPGLRFKWLWFLVICLGAGQMSRNWESGQEYFYLLTVSFPPVGIAQTSPYDPIWVWFLLPVGAMIFRGWRKRFGPQPAKPRRFDD